MSLARDSSKTVEVIIVKLGTATVSDMKMHLVSIILTLTFIQGHIDLNPDYLRNYSSNAHQVCCEDSPIKGLYDYCQSDDIDLHSRSQVCLKLDYFLTCNVLDNIYTITFKLCMMVDLCMAYMLILVLMTLNLTLKNVCKTCPSWGFS